MCPRRGLFIVLEGLDRSGKSTQVDKLVQRLENDGHKARLQKFPGERTPRRIQPGTERAERV